MLGGVVEVVSTNPTVGQIYIFTGIVGRPQTSSSPPEILLLAVARRFFCFGSLVILDLVCRYLSLFLLYINIKIGKNTVDSRYLKLDYLEKPLISKKKSGPSFDCCLLFRCFTSTVNI